ncbi:hypothetical protein LCGC14_0516530 [marine sediment metagenome]|uniref:Uncharacterized protein n=1 Tax=marine sediment metagenome TaxID=412755 RepID=A0A0F9RZS6_9ZZZZ
MRMDEILAQLMGEDETEKNASEQATSEDSVIATIASALSDEEVAEVEKIASSLEQEKLAEDYVTLGRFLARGFHDELGKIAGSEKNAAGGAVTGFGGTAGGPDGMKGMTGTAYTSPGAPGNKTIAAGGDTSPGANSAEPGPKAPNAEGQSYTTPQDGSNVLAKIKATVDQVHQPMSATKKQDAMGMLHKIVDAAKQQKRKQHPAEVPSNLT